MSARLSVRRGAAAVVCGHNAALSYCESSTTSNSISGLGNLARDVHPDLAALHQVVPARAGLGQAEVLRLHPRRNGRRRHRQVRHRHARQRALHQFRHEQGEQTFTSCGVRVMRSASPMFEWIAKTQRERPSTRWSVISPSQK